MFLGFSEAIDIDPSCGMGGFMANWLKGRAQRVAVNVATCGWGWTPEMFL